MDDGMAGFCVRPRGGGGGGGGGNKCGRWNPTAEQVKVLTELFRSGLRTPSTDQIQKISSQLSFYGKIESKNVFYWFQNHKARERQKRRRVSVPPPHEYEIYSDNENHRLSSAKRFAEANHQPVLEPERVIETLQLFPLNSFHEAKSPHGKTFRLLANEYNGSTMSFPYNHGAAVDDHGPLDLRLSFI